MKDSYTQEELNFLNCKKSTDGRFIKVDGYVFQRSPDGVFDNTYETRFPKGSMKAIEKPFDESLEHAQNHKQFVVDYVMWMTKNERKRLVQTDRGYEIQMKCQGGWGCPLWTKNAENMYSELERDYDFIGLSRDGDSLRYKILTEVRA